MLVTSGILYIVYSNVFYYTYKGFAKNQAVCSDIRVMQPVLFVHFAWSFF